MIVFDATRYEPRSKAMAMAWARLPAGPLIYRINRDLLRAVRQHKPDVVWFDKPTHFTRETILEVKKTGAQTVCYNQDNPFCTTKYNGVNRFYWLQFRRVFRLFDLHCLFREADVVRYSQWGLPWIKTMFSFEPSMQFPPPVGWSDSDRTRGISYIGSPYDERQQFLLSLGTDKALPLTIAGPRWKGLLSPELYARYVSHDYLADAEYREAIWKSRINLSFVTHFHEDDIGHKSVEIAACQSFLLAFRSDGHLGLFDEDREAVFFSDLDECADKCRFYLDRPDLRDAIARRARERAVASGYDNDAQLAHILNRLDGAA